MRTTETPLAGLKIIEPDVYRDTRGYLFQSWNETCYAAAGIEHAMVQDNISWSDRDVLRGMHFQYPSTQAKLVFVLTGVIFDVAVDVRRGSPTFGRWFGTELSASQHRQLYIAHGFAHGFCVLSDGALVAYKCSQEYRPADETTILWNDPRLGIEWPASAPLLSAKDASALPLDRIPLDRLPEWRPAGGEG